MQGEPKGKGREKERYWRRMIGEAARSRLSVGQFWNPLAWRQIGDGACPGRVLTC